MKAHIKVVGVIDLLTGVVFIVTGMFISLQVLVFGPWINGAALWEQGGGMVALAIMLSISGAFCALGIPSLIAGIGLMKQKGWARTLAIALGVLALVCFPLGTVAGLYTLWALTREETEEQLAAAS
jgi:hypothetical protein